MQFLHLASDNFWLCHNIRNIAKHKCKTVHRDAKVIYAHTIEDAIMSPVVSKHVKYEPSSENGVMAILANMFADKSGLDESERGYFEDMDLGYISSECSFDEEEQETIKNMSSGRSSMTLVLGSDLYSHPKASQIAALAGIIARTTQFEVIIVPSNTNTLGVSQICELDTEGDHGYVVGYNAKGDFELSNTLSDNENMLAMPALNQQEGTFTNIDKRVVPISVAVGFEGYCLNDLVLALNLGLNKKYTIDYTESLPSQKGYKGLAFDSLHNEYLKDGTEDRGYLLGGCADTRKSFELEEVDSIGEMNGVLLYVSNPPLSFEVASKCSTKDSKANDIIIGSKAFMMAAKIADGREIAVEVGDKKLQARFVLDLGMKGTIALFQGGLDSNGYKICKAKITSLES